MEDDTAKYGAELRRFIKTHERRHRKRLLKEQEKFNATLVALRGPERGYICQLARRLRVQQSTQQQREEVTLNIVIEVPSHIRSIVRRMFGQSAGAARVLHGYINDWKTRKRLKLLYS